MKAFGRCIWCVVMLATMWSVGMRPAPAQVTSGDVWDWGSYLGNGTNTPSNVPVHVPGLSGVASVSQGGNHSLALKSDGTIWAWGANESGQLGNGTLTDSSVPVQVSGLASVVAIAAGWSASLAVKSDGSMWTWGINDAGQLGNGTNNNSKVPVQVSALANVKAVAAGYRFGLALKQDGTVWSWGSNSNGQLGNGTKTDSNVPVLVSGLAGVSNIAAGTLFSMAVKADGTLWVWGDNSYSQLGIYYGSKPYSSIPIQVHGLSSIVSVAGSFFNILALRSDGTVWTWGTYLSISALYPYDSMVDPIQVPGLANVKAVANPGLKLALKQDGTVWAWGCCGLGNGNGIYSDNNKGSNVPVQVLNLDHVIAIAGPIAIVPAGIASTPGNIDFGTQKAGSLSPSQSFTIINNASTPLTITNMTLSGNEPGDFVLSAPALPITLTANQSTSASVQFSAATVGTKTALVLVTGTGFSSPKAIGLTGSADYNVQLLSPANGSVNVPTDVTLEWANVPGATNYDVEPTTTPPPPYGYWGSTSAPTTSFTLHNLSPATTYYWDILVFTNSPLAFRSQSWTFTTAGQRPLTAPILTAPTNGSTTTGTSVNAQWSAVSGASQYAVYLGSSATSLSVWTTVNVPNVSTTFSNLNPGTYFWQVVATAGSQSAKSAIWSFTVPGGAFSAPNIVWPLNGSVDLASALTLQWTPVSGATKYLVYFGSTPASLSLYATVGAPTVRYPVYNLSPGTNYSWQVAASNGSATASSAVASFTTAGQAAPFAGPTLVWPPNGSTAAGISLKVKWTAVPGASHYQVYFGTSAASLAPYSIVNVPMVMAAFYNLSPGTTYYWQVAAVAGTQSARSVIWSFTIPGGSTTIGPSYGQ